MISGEHIALQNEEIANVAWAAGNEIVFGRIDL
jgi:hypothetical protein